MKTGIMNNIHEYYDTMTDVSVLSHEAINAIGLAREKVQLALGVISNLKRHGDTAIFPVSNVTTNDVIRICYFLSYCSIKLTV